MTPLLITYIAAGGLGIVSGAATLGVRKGGRLHRAFGTVFVPAMLTMAALSAYLAVFGLHPAEGAAPPKASMAIGVLLGKAYRENGGPAG